MLEEHKRIKGTWQICTQTPEGVIVSIVSEAFPTHGCAVRHFAANESRYRAHGDHLGLARPVGNFAIDIVIPPQEVISSASSG